MQQFAQQMVVSLDLPTISDRLELRVIAALTSGPSRFTALQRTTGLSAKTLSAKLKKLEHEAIITRTVYAQVPVRVEYELTQKGFELVQLLAGFSHWQRKWAV